MMRVVTLSHVFPRPDESAFGIFVQRRAAEMARLASVRVVAPLPWFPGGHFIGRRRRHEVPRHAERDGLSIDYPRILSVPGVAKSLDPLAYALSLLPHLRRLRRSFAYEVIDAHFGYPDGVAAAWLGRWLRCPVVVTWRGCEADFVRSPTRRVQMAWSLRGCRLIAVSEGLAQLARTLGATRVRVIPNGVDTVRFSPGDCGEARRRLGLPTNRRIVLVPAAFVPFKRHALILRSVAGSHVAADERVRFVFVGLSGGTASVLGALRELTRSLGLVDDVTFAVDRPPEEMPDWYRSADVVCLASEREGSPNVVREAVACGVPVVATNVGDIASVVQHGKDGLVLDNCDETTLAAALVQALRARWDTAAIAARGVRRGWSDTAREAVDELAMAVRESRVA